MHTSHTTRFSLVLLALLASLVGVQVLQAGAQRSAERAADRRIQLVRDVERLRYYDELLTMSARLAAASGDTSYVVRYHRAVPKLGAVIRDALAVVPDPAANDAVGATDAANQALIALEEESFRRLAAGDRTGAYALVSSPRYTGLKAEYRRGMDTAIERMRLAGESARTDAVRRQHLGLAVGIGAAALLALLSVLTALGLHRSQRARTGVEEQLRVQAHVDPLTGLANRRSFGESLSTALDGPDADGTTVLFLDLDHFKSVNDTRGHHEGDVLLGEVAQRLSHGVSLEPGVVVARLGGDEFAVLLPATGAWAVERLADRLVRSLSQPYEAAPHASVTASIGLASTGPGLRGAGALLRGADLAMYDAKARGRACWSRYAEHMHTELLDRVQLEGQLRDGIARGELVLHFQPVFDLANGRLDGVEALVRWEHPERGLLPPAAFVPVAENSDLILALGSFVLERACQQLVGWPGGGTPAAPSYVAVNVSPRELHRAGYAAQVLAVLQRTGLPASSLVLEVTESTVMRDQGAVVAVLTELRRAGVRVAIDDFGTGHSSVARLHELPVDVVKIDRSFVAAAAPDDAGAGDTTLLVLLVDLARRLALDVVAEGIETPRQLEAVRRSGCAYGQGFLLGRPAPLAPATSPSGAGAAPAAAGR